MAVRRSLCRTLVLETVNSSVRTQLEELTDPHSLCIYALRGIIENAKVAYEAVTGLPYDEKDDVPEPKDEDSSDTEDFDENEWTEENASDDD